MSPTRTTDARHAIAGTDTAAELISSRDRIAELFPQIHRLSDGLTQDHFDAEFAAGLEIQLDRITAELHTGPD